MGKETLKDEMSVMCLESQIITVVPIAPKKLIGTVVCSGGGIGYRCERRSQTSVVYLGKYQTLS